MSGIRRDVLHVVWSGGIGGTERHAEAILRYANDFGSRLTHHALFLASGGAVSEPLEKRGVARALGLKHGLDLPGLVRFARTLRRDRPSLLHFHTRSLGPHAAAAFAVPRTPRVYTEHAPGVFRRAGKFRTFYALFGRRMDRVIAIAPAVARAVESFGVAGERIVTIEHGILTPRRDFRLTDGTPTIGLVARLEPQKRPDLFVATLAALRRRGIECRGLVVGSGSLLHELQEQSGAEGVIDVIEFVGEQADVVPWLDRCDVFFMTSEVEPFGLTALEAMARSVPVVAMPSVGGLSDLAQRGGLLLADRAVATAVDALARLINDAATREEFAERGSAVAEAARFDRVFSALEDVYAAVLGEPAVAFPVVPTSPTVS